MILYGEALDRLCVRLNMYLVHSLTGDQSHLSVVLSSVVSQSVEHSRYTVFTVFAISPYHKVSPLGLYMISRSGLVKE